MPNSKRIIATCALVLGVVGGMASPALAETHGTVLLEKRHSTVTADQSQNSITLGLTERHQS
ncbi:hypothetical protein [Streptomyces boncukensis]|uniref:Uncharacterized protein n=1 Tax=Streptomyces boncukensis TaxID=2711219 RepID=A0A6G4X0A3_9ACTN|nr:hypothetical protein [Streptomyces boncukensis]NGO70552.1 hypothetical protein [Streptomyces boncukensis]